MEIGVGPYNLVEPGEDRFGILRGRVFESLSKFIVFLDFLIKYVDEIYSYHNLINLMILGCFLIKDFEIIISKF
jgi:hypothetical protein